MGAVEILIADDHAAFRRNLRTLLESHGQWHVCGEAADGEEAVAKAKQLRPQIILMDMSMPRMDGAQATGIIRKEVPDSDVILVSQNDVALLSRQVSELGARSYVSKANIAQELTSAIDAALAGRKNGKDTQAAVSSQIDDLSASEMASLIQQKDWSKTPVGAPATWSPALRMMVSLLLANRFPLLLWWGPQYIQFYNDAYKAIPGAKHPTCLGQPANECWSEIWHILKPLIDTPFSGGPSTWSDDLALEIYRSPESLEETHFTVAYSPVPDSSAPRGIGGVLATVHEITEKIIGERRLALLRDLAARGAEGRTTEEACVLAAQTLAKYPKDIPFALVYLLDSDQKHARLACSTGVADDLAGIQRDVVIAETSVSNRHWPFAEVLRRNAVSVVKNIASRLPEVPQGPWADPPRNAAVLPIPSSKPHEVKGFLVLGVSPRLRLDDDYHTFFQLIAAQLGTAIANADAYEEERRRAEALAQIDRAKTLFFSNVSHEFRTPLTLMLGPLEDALLASDSLDGEQRERLEVAHRNSLRLLKLVNTLLDFSRIEAGRIEACYQETNLSQLTAELASVFRSAIERAGLELIVTCEAIDEPVYVDPELWEKIVFNLLSNALKFTFSGEIEVSVRRVGGSVELAVRDSGTGIPAHELPHVFERFYRVKGSHGRTFEGSGIGLALVQELTKLHGGTVEVKSEEGHGSAFFVRIPTGKNHLPHDRIGAERKQTSTGLRGEAYVQEALRWLPGLQNIPDDFQITESSVAGESQSEGRNGSRRRSRILLADDNADMREYVRRLLGEKYDVVAVPDGQAALESARLHRPDLIVTDVMMPRLDGFGLLRELHADIDLKHIPVIVLSARAGEESRVEGLQSGADDYLIKPFSARELLARVDSQLAMAKMRREGADVERKLRAEAELERSRLHGLFMQAPAAIGLLSGPEHRFTFVNHDYVKLTGRRGAEDFIGKTVREAFPELEGQGIFELLDGVYQTGLPYNATARKVTLNRGLQSQPEDVYFDFVYQPIRAVDGHVEGILVHAVDVTYKALAQQDLEKRERQFREMIDALPAAIYTTDAEGRLTHFNPAAVEFSGRTPELGTDQWCVSWKLYYPDGQPMRHDECPMAIALKEGRIVRGAEAIAERPDGVRRWFTPFPTPIRDHHGRIIGGINMLLDITERKDAERANRLLAAIVDSSDDAILSKTLDGTITSWNKSAEQLFGYTAEEALGQPITLIVPWERRSEEEDILRRLARGERLDHLETVRRRKDGSTLDVALTSSPLRDSTGRVVGASSITRDITERKRIEQALRESEKKYRDFAETASIALHWVAKDGTIVWANRAELELLGYSSDEYIGHNISEFHADAPILQDILRRLSVGERIKEYEARLRAKDGSVRHVIIDSSALFEDGKFIHTRCFTRDISERKRAEEALRRSQSRLAVEVDALAKLNQWSGRLWRSRTLQEGLDQILGAAIELLGADKGNIQLLDRDRSKLNIAVQRGFEKEFLDFFQEVTTEDDSACGRALRAGERIVIEDIETDEPYAPLRPIAQRAGYRAVVSAPLIGIGGMPLGMVSVHFGAAHRPSEQDLQRLDLYVRQAADFIERCRSEETLRQSEEQFRKLSESLDTEVRARTKELEERNAEVLKQSEQVRDLSWRLLRTQDEERRHIARELHDSAGQTLTVLGMNLAQFVHKTGRTAPDVAGEAETIQEMVQQLHRDIRTTSYLLHPPLLDESGLYSALSWYTQGLVERSGLQIDLRMSQEFGRLPGDMELVVFRLIQECLTNIHRHSGSKLASIRIARESDQVEVEVRDQGVGMSPERLAQVQSGASGVGIRGMRERLRQFKGEMKIESDSSGTRIFVVVPVPKATMPDDESKSESLQAAI